MVAFLLLVWFLNPGSLTAAQTVGAGAPQIPAEDTAPAPYTAGGEGAREAVSGKWKAWVEGTLADDPKMHAPLYRYVVYRQGPNDRSPTALYREISNRGLKVWLREDGTAIIQGGADGRPQLVCADKEPVEIMLPRPNKWKYQLQPYTSIGHMWFLGDVVVYSRDAYPGHTLIGFFRIDPARRQVVDSHLSLEVVEELQEPAFAAAIDWDGPLFRAGDLVFWTNYGSNSSTGQPWRQRKVRVLNLKSNTITDAAEVSIETLRQHRAELMDFLEQKVHNRKLELEVWTISVIEQIGSKDDLKRLTPLSKSTERYYPYSLEPLYTKAITAISSR